MGVSKRVLFLQADVGFFIQKVAPLFGPYVKYIIDDLKDLAVPSRNSFEVLLASHQELSQPICKLPSFVEEWYDGQVAVSLMAAVFEFSSPIRLATEL